MTRRILSTLPLALLLVSGAGTAAWADHRHDPHDEIRAHASSLVDHSREMYDEIRLHFRGHPLTAGLLSDVLQLHRSARRMTGYADAHSPSVTLEREVSRMETAFHYLEGSLRGISRHHGSHHHVRELMRSMDHLVHEIHDDIHNLEGRRYYSPAVGRTDLGPSDWYFGGGGFNIRLGR